MQQTSPSAERNRAPIMQVLGPLLPHDGLVLEVASGTGQHAFAFAGSFSGIQWQPSDPNAAARASIDAWRAQAGRDNLLPPLNIDVCDDEWWREVNMQPAGIVAINLLHISPWRATEGLMAGAGALLAPGGFVYIYGAFKRDGQHISESNLQFDASLRARNAEWGVRDIADVARVAEKHGLMLEKVVAMPANNFSLIFRMG